MMGCGSSDAGGSGMTAAVVFCFAFCKCVLMRNITVTKEDYFS